MKNSVRAFIAVKIDPALQSHLNDIQEKLKTASDSVRWVRPENIHLTLKFLGDISQDQIKTVSTTLSSISAGFPAFIFELTGLGVFPHIKTPRIIWIGAKDENEQLIKLAKKIDEDLGRQGFAKETKDFHPHLTLGRVKSMKSTSKLTPLMGLISVPTGIQQQVNYITLFSSQLTADGSIYESLGKFRLSPSISRPPA